MISCATGAPRWRVVVFATLLAAFVLPTFEPLSGSGFTAAVALADEGDLPEDYVPPPDDPPPEDPWDDYYEPPADDPPPEDPWEDYYDEDYEEDFFLWCILEGIPPELWDDYLEVYLTLYPYAGP